MATLGGGHRRSSLRHRREGGRPGSWRPRGSGAGCPSSGYGRLSRWRSARPPSFRPRRGPTAVDRDTASSLSRGAAGRGTSPLSRRAARSCRRPRASLPPPPGRSSDVVDHRTHRDVAAGREGIARRISPGPGLEACRQIRHGPERGCSASRRRGVHRRCGHCGWVVLDRATLARNRVLSPDGSRPRVLVVTAPAEGELYEP